jgi:Flp pilus assembly pilin Flp
MSVRRVLEKVEKAVGGQENGQDMIEYALLAALISIVAIGVIILIGPYLQNAFQAVINALNSA